MDELRPEGLFDRDHEWRDLLRFAQSPATGPRVGVIYGRRRQGKSFLLRALVRQVGGIYHQALEEETAPALGHLGKTLRADAHLAGQLTFSDWSEAIAALLDRAGPDRIAVIDELPYLLTQSPELASIIQKAFDDARNGQGAAFRLLLCGSAMSIMERVLSGQEALRGRAVLDMPLLPFDFRQSAAYWEIESPEIAFLVDAVLGGTPGYRDLLDGATPASPETFVEWLAAGVLNPSHALFREADYLLTEDPAIADRALYQSVLATIAEGRSTRSAVASQLGRDESALRHPLLVLERAGFIRRDADLLLSKRPLIRIADPYLRFYHAVVRPDLAGSRLASSRRHGSKHALASSPTCWALISRTSPGSGPATLPRGAPLADGPAGWALPRSTTRATAAAWNSTSSPSRATRTRIDQSFWPSAKRKAGPRNAASLICAASRGAGSSSLRRPKPPRAICSSSREPALSRTSCQRRVPAKDVELIDLARLYTGE